MGTIPHTDLDIMQVELVDIDNWEKTWWNIPSGIQKLKLIYWLIIMTVTVLYDQNTRRTYFTQVFFTIAIPVELIKSCLTLPFYVNRIWCFLMNKLI